MPNTDPLEIARHLDLTLVLRARVRIEHSGAAPLTLPVRDMRARIVCCDLIARPKVEVEHLGANRRWSLQAMVRAQGQAPPPEPVPPQYGVYARDEHVVATAPGEFTISTEVDFDGRQAPDPEMDDLHNLLTTANDMRLDLALRIVGVDKRILLTAPLSRGADPTRSEREAGGLGMSIQETLGRWELVIADDDPWADSE